MHWSFKMISVDINGISSSLWPCLSQLAKGKCDIVHIKETEIDKSETERNVHCIWKFKTN